MPGRSDIFSECKRAGMLAIGRQLGENYDAVEEPVPKRLAALIQKLAVPQRPGSADMASTPPLSLQTPSQVDPNGRMALLRRSTRQASVAVRRAKHGATANSGAPGNPL
jgi:hypothetical protein